MNDELLFKVMGYCLLIAGGCSLVTLVSITWMLAKLAFSL